MIRLPTVAISRSGSRRFWCSQRCCGCSTTCCSRSWPALRLLTCSRRLRIASQGAALIAHIPGYFKRIKELIVDPNFPWLNWLGSAETGKTASDLVGQVATWLMSFSYSLWTGGTALVSFASVLIVMPVVTFYLIRDWHAMINRVDSWVPVRQRGS